LTPTHIGFFYDFRIKDNRKNLCRKNGPKYDFSLPPYFARWKRAAIEDSSLKKGDSMLVFCCGTGFDVPHAFTVSEKPGKAFLR
jgi:ubiquinone/menaquinone biosynthesis C-methylase UbiE